MGLFSGYPGRAGGPFIFTLDSVFIAVMAGRLRDQSYSTE